MLLASAENPWYETLNRVWPVGSVYISTAAVNPADLLGIGVWSAIGAGRVLVGQDAGQSEFDTLGETGGAKDVTLTAAQSGLPQHTHTQDPHAHTQRYHSATTGALSGPTTAPDTSSNTVTNYGITTANATAVNQNAGPTSASQAHTNLQPYLVVKMWERTA